MKLFLFSIFKNYYNTKTKFAIIQFLIYTNFRIYYINKIIRFLDYSSINFHFLLNNINIFTINCLNFKNLKFNITKLNDYKNYNLIYLTFNTILKRLYSIKNLKNLENKNIKLSKKNIKVALIFIIKYAKITLNKSLFYIHVKYKNFYIMKNIFTIINVFKLNLNCSYILLNFNFNKFKILLKKKKSIKKRIKKNLVKF